MIMGITFEKKQIVSSTELIRSFRKYLEEEVGDHDIFIFKRNTPEAVLVAYERYENMKNQLEELKDLLEHVAIYEIVEQRKKSPAKKISLDHLEKKYRIVYKIDGKNKEVVIFAVGKREDMKVYLKLVKKLESRLR